jgi:alkyl hydroperoxide reductase subunit AhpC
MKTLFFSITVFVLGGCASSPRTDPHPVIDNIAAPFRAARVETSHKGESIELPAPGKVTVVDFWMTYCEPCVKAIPKLEKIWQTVDKSNVAFVGVSVDPEENVTQKTLQETLKGKVTFPMVFDGKDAVLQGIYKIGGIVPATYIVDKKGRIRFYFDGSEGDVDKLEQAIQILAAE